MISPEWAGVIGTFAILGGTGLIIYGKTARIIDDLEKIDEEQWIKINSILREQMESQKIMFEFKLEMEKKNSTYQLNFAQWEGKLNIIIQSIDHLTGYLKCPAGKTDK